MKKISPNDLAAMNMMDAPVKIDLVYAQADHPENILKPRFTGPKRFYGCIKICRPICE